MQNDPISSATNFPFSLIGSNYKRNSKRQKSPKMEEDFTTSNSSSVQTTVQKFEASHFVFKTPMNSSPKMMSINRENYPDGGPVVAEIMHLDESTDSPPSSPTEPPALPTTDPPDTDEEEVSIQIEKVPKKSKKKRDVQKSKAPKPDSKQASPSKLSPSKQRSKEPSPEKLPSSPKASGLVNAKEMLPPKSPLNLNLVPRKSSLKKPKSKAKLELKGLWFNMNDQYPIESFSGRETILEKIHEVVHGQKSRDVRPISRAIVLVGKPSMGKTEIARKFAFKFYVDCNGKGNVIWMDGTSKESIIEALLLLEEKELLPIAKADPGSMLELSTEEKPPNKKEKAKKKSDPETELQERIAAILRYRIFQDNPTLFIFDNSRAEEDILEFIPKLAPFGHIPNILVTSSFENNWNNARVIKVEEFSFKEAVEYLLKSFRDCQGFTKFQAEDLAKELHRYPPLMGKAKKIVTRYLLQHGDSDRAILRLEKNIGLVRRLKDEGIIETREVEIAILGTDRGGYYEEDPYLREYDGELRNHVISMQIHRLEAVLSKVTERNDLTVLTVNEDAYVLAMLAYMVGKNSRILAVYDSEHSDGSGIDLLKAQLNSDDEDLIKKGKVDLRLVEIPAVKPPKQTKTSTVLDKVRSSEKKSFDLILCNLYVEQDLSSVKKLLTSGGRFVTCMSSVNVSSIVKKSDQKKIQIKIMKHDFPELLVIATKL